MGISIWQLLIVLVIVVVVFGAKRLGSLGGDLGAAVKGFREAMKEDDDSKSVDQQQRLEQSSSDRIIDPEPEREDMTSKSTVREKDSI